MTDALERLREHAFETRNPKAAKPLVRAGTFVKVGVRAQGWNDSGVASVQSGVKPGQGY